MISLVSLSWPALIYAEPKVPEKLNYYLFWSGIRAGSAALETENTGQGLTITSSARSADFISLFYKVEDMVQSTLYPDGHPSKYTIKLREGRYRRDKSVGFEIKQDDNTQKITYKNNRDNETVEFNTGKIYFDSLSAFYEIRKRELAVGRTEYIDVFDDKKFWTVEVRVLRKEKVRTPAGEFNTIVIQPILKSEGIFIKKGDLFIWLTDDDRKVPVLLRSAVKVGSFTAKLAEGTY
ncbi:MAG: DUF3108 domain-containing protein [Nitrospirae bacterium]|nr:DUF3108 domain-containing protein [Nitrospirota bacterium]